MSGDHLVPFNFKDIEPDNYTFTGRLRHFLYVTNMKNFFASDTEINEGV